MGGTYYLKNVWHAFPEETRKEVLEFWQQCNPHRNLNGNTRIVHLIRDTGRQIVGTCSVLPVFVPRLNNHLYYYRNVFHPAHRKPDLSRKLLIRTRDFLNQEFDPKQKDACIGMLFTLDSTAPPSEYRHAVAPGTGFIFIGHNRIGQQMRVYYFKDAII